jgi:hypothetical protein
MIGAAKDKSSLPGSLTALRVLLCLLITFLLAGTRAEAFFAPPDQAPGQIAAFQPDSTGKTTTAWQYDALDSLIAAKSADPWLRTPKTLQDQMTLAAAQKGAGSKLIDNLGDDRFKGWEKWEYKVKSAEGRDSVVHYVRDPASGNLMDFKFKKSSSEGLGKYEKALEPKVGPGDPSAGWP